MSFDIYSVCFPADLVPGVDAIIIIMIEVSPSLLFF